MAITPIPSTRVSDILVRTRLLSQLQFDQRELLRIQSQLSTGRRIILPSEDAPAALRAISLQRLIERKEQVKINLSTNQSFLSATDSALNTVSGLLAEIRGGALTVAGSTSTDERGAIKLLVDRAIQQLVDVGNQSFRGRFLFAGTRTTEQPFDIVDGFVRYNGNEGELRSFSDLDVLFETSINGNEVFGAISDPIRSKIDLNPPLTAITLLTDVRGGLGISNGSIQVSDGTNTSIVDISGATTVGDIARMIEANAPPTRTATVTITPTGLVIELDAAGAGNLTITEVGGGTTANELGILEETGVGVGPLVGEDLDPIVRLTTPLTDVLGSRASALIAPALANNNFIITATTNSAQLNGVVVQFVDDNLLQATLGLTSGNEVAVLDPTARAASAALTFAGADNDLILTATTAGINFNNVTVNVTATAGGGVPVVNYDAGTKTLNIDLEADGTTNANQIIVALTAVLEFTAALDTSAEGANTGLGPIAAFADANFASTGNSGGAANTLYINVENGVSITTDVVQAINTGVPEFNAVIDTRDATSALQAGQGTIDINTTATTSGGSGINLDRTGIRVNNGGKTFDITFTDPKIVTVEDLLNKMNGAGAGLLAEINEDGNGINVRSRLSGSDFTIGEIGGNTATELGIRSMTSGTRLSDLNRGLGTHSVTGPDFTIKRNDNVDLEIDISSATTIGDVIDLINNHPDNQDAAAVVARLAVFGNGIELVDDDPTAAGTISVDVAVGVNPDKLSLAAIHLGLIPAGQEISNAPVAALAATAAVDLTNPDTDLTFSAVIAGTGRNGTQIIFANNGGGPVTLNFDPIGNTYTVGIDPGITTAGDIETAVDAAGLFTATLVSGDGTATVAFADVGLTFTAGGGTPEILTGEDVNPLETDGVYNSLIRLRDALDVNDDNFDIVQVQLALEALDVDASRVNFARAEIGARQQGLDILQLRLGSEDIELQEALSKEIDVDLVEAISEMSARQAAFQASLQTTASILQLTLLDFL